AGFRQPEAIGEGAAADGQQHDVGLDLLRSAALRGLDRQRNPLIRPGRGRHLAAEAEPDALLRQDALEGHRHFPVHCRHDAVEELDHRHLGTQAAPDAAQFQTDDAAADDDEMPGHAVQFERAGGGDDALLVHLHPTQRHALAAGGNDDFPCFMDRPGDFHLTRRDDAAGAFQPADLVLAEQEFHAFHVRGHHLVLARLHSRQVQLHTLHQHTVVLERVDGVVELLGRLQQRLGWDAADVQARAAQGGALFHTGDVHAQLRGADRAHIAPGAGADDDDVEWFTHVRWALTTGERGTPYPRGGGQMPAFPCRFKPNPYAAALPPPNRWAKTAMPRRNVRRPSVFGV